jgi:hypothetical protein
VYFPETGHTLAFGFKRFWEANGGLAVFGYPLTEEFGVNDLAAGRVATAQVFERQRFEHHPELAGTPYEISLGRLGAEDAERRGLLATAAFQPLPRPATRPDCPALAGAAHSLCDDFRDYWSRYGLDLGDPGLTARESLALFGYPISEAFVDPTTGLITQYFERAIFERHPGNPPGERVLLRRPGAEALARIGW